MSELVRRTDVPELLADQLRMADVLARSSLLPRHLQGHPENVFVILKGAQALSIPAFWALQSMHVVDGKLGMDATLMRALVTSAGHRFRVVERSNEQATIEITRKDLPDGASPYRATFSMEDARRAKLSGKNNWQQYGPAMMVARATSIGVREECPELLFGVIYTPDELGAVTDEDGRVVEGEVVEPATATEEGRLNRARHLAGEVAELDWFELGPWWRAHAAEASDLGDLVLGGSESDPVPLTLRQVYAGALALACETQTRSREGLREIWAWANEARCLDHVVTNFAESGRMDLLRVVLGERSRLLPDREPDETPDPETTQPVPAEPTVEDVIGTLADVGITAERIDDEQ